MAEGVKLKVEIFAIIFKLSDEKTEILQDLMTGDFSLKNSHNIVTMTVQNLAFYISLLLKNDYCDKIKASIFKMG